MHFFITSLVVVVLFLTPDSASAFEGLVTCTSGDECNFCSFVDMVNGLIEWLIVIVTTLTILLLSFAGFRLITARGDAAALENAKKILVSSFIGILIMLASWTVVDTFLKVVAGGDLGVWNVVECGGTYAYAPAVGIDVDLKIHEGLTIEDDGEGDPLGFFFRIYSRDSTRNCKQLSTYNFPDLEMCRSALSDVTSSGQNYVARACGSGVSVSNAPSWSTLPDCGVSAAVVDGLTVNTSMQPIFDPVPGGSSMVRPGAAQKMQATLAGPFARLQQGFGRQVVINDAIAKAGTSRETNTPGSRHFYGDALDLSTRGMSNADKIRLFNEARQAGFTGFGFGNNILHVDLGPRRGWAYGNSTYGGQNVQSLIGSI